jgi:hypothetical protein
VGVHDVGAEAAHLGDEVGEGAGVVERARRPSEPADAPVVDVGTPQLEVVDLAGADLSHQEAVVEALGVEVSGQGRHLARWSAHVHAGDHP